MSSEALSRWSSQNAPLDPTPNEPRSERPAAIPQTTSEQEDPERVREPSEGFWPDELPRVPLRYLYGVTPKMRAAAESFLPREGEKAEDGSWRGETAAEYRRRLSRSVCFGYLRAAVKGIRGKIFRKPLVVESAPDALDYLVDDCDGQGTSLQQFSGDLTESAWLDGVDYLFVDRPRAESEATNRAEERQTLGDPYFEHVRVARLIGQPRRVRYLGKSRIAQIRIVFDRELGSESRFHSDSEEVVRVYEAGNPDAEPGEQELVDEDGSVTMLPDATLPRWEEWKLVENEQREEVWKLVEGPVTYSVPVLPGETADEHRVRQAFFIPLVDLGIGPRPWMRGGQPPLESLGHLEICHWQKQSDLDTIEHVANLPRPYATGVDDPESFGKSQVGAYRMFALREPNAKLGFMEIQGAGIAELKESVKRLELRMRQESAEPMVGQVQRQETATGRVIDAETAASPIEASVIALEDAITLAYTYAGWWIGVALPDDFAVKGNRDLGGTALEFERMRIALEIAKLPATTPEPIIAEIVRAAVRSGVFAEDTDVDLLVEQIQNASPSLASSLTGLEDVFAPPTEPEA